METGGGVAPAGGQRAVSCPAHESDGGGSAYGCVFRCGGDEGSDKASEGAAAAGDAGHHLVAAVDNEGACAVGDDIARTADGDDGVVLSGQVGGQGACQRESCRVFKVGGGSIDTAGIGSEAGEGFDLADVAADGSDVVRR